MANNLTVNPLICNTVGTLITGTTSFHSIVYSGATTAAHIATITDKMGNIKAKLTASVAGKTETFTPAKTVHSDGLVLSVISSGEVYIYQ